MSRWRVQLASGFDVEVVCIGGEHRVRLRDRLGCVRDLTIDAARLLATALTDAAAEAAYRITEEEAS